MELTTEPPSTTLTEPSLEHARWLLQRTDHLRSSYANRAALVLGIDAAAIASLFAALATPFSREPLYVVVSTLILACVVSSIWCALLASGTVFSPSARSAVKSPDISRRLFLSPTDTWAEISTFARFCEVFRAANPDALLEHVLAELAIDLKLQGLRYSWLKWSIRLLFLSILLLALLYAALLLSGLRADP